MLRTAAALVAPAFTRFVDDDAAVRLGEWIARITLSYLFSPSENFDIGDAAARTCARRRLRPPRFRQLRRGVPMTTNNELIGRDEINDLEAILSVSNTDVDASDHTVGANFDAVFTWDYERSRPALGKLYEKAKTSQWNVTTDLDWSTPVDQEALALERDEARGRAVLRRPGRPLGHAVREVDREGVGRARDRGPELDALAVPAR